MELKKWEVFYVASGAVESRMAQAKEASWAQAAAAKPKPAGSRRRRRLQRPAVLSGMLWALLMGACEDAFTCKLGEASGCPEGSYCWAGEGGGKKGANGLCVVANPLVDMPPSAEIATWKLVSASGEEIAPLYAQAGAKEAGAANPAAGWASAGEARIEAVVWGLQEAEALHAWAGPEAAEVACAPADMQTEEGALWTCALPEGWAVFPAPDGTYAEVVDIGLKPGAGAAQTRSFRVDARAPLVRLLAFGGTRCQVGGVGCEGQPCAPLSGSTHLGVCRPPSVPPPNIIYVCAEARDSESGMRVLESQTQPMATLNLGEAWGEASIPMGWQKEEVEKERFAACWRGSLPASFSGEPGDLFFSLHLGTEDQAGNLWSGLAHGSLDRLACGARAEGISPRAVKAPLAYAGERLVFGTSLGEGAPVADNALYFFNPRTCAVEARLHTGAVQGPIVALGESGRIAVALGGGGPEGRSGQRVALVNAAGPPAFAGESSRDCIAGAAGTEAGARFERGLTLLAGGNAEDSPAWSLVAPANSALENQSRLMLYRPGATLPQTRCASESFEGLPTELKGLVQSRFMLTPVQFNREDEDGNTALEVLAVHELLSILSWWSFDRATELLAVPLVKGWATHFSNVSGIALKGGPVIEDCKTLPEDICPVLWLSGNGLQRYCYCRSWNELLLDARTSPAVVDSTGRAYVVAQTLASGSMLQRFSAICSDTQPCAGNESCVPFYGLNGFDAQGICRRQRPLPFYALPVGSPLLGEPPPGAPPEIYVVDATGTVLALDAEELTPLWAQNLGMEVSPTAQPVLVGNTLWVVGTDGEVRGLRVGSHGLSRTAHWPKAFHDNCNTSSGSVTFAPMSSASYFNIPDTFHLPECFTALGP